MADLVHIVVLVDAGTDLDFLYMDDMLLLLRFFGLLELLETELAVVHNLDDRRLLSGSDLHEVKAPFFRYSASLICRYNLGLALSDKTHCRRRDIFVNFVFSPVFRLEPAIFYVDNRPPFLLFL